MTDFKAQGKRNRLSGAAFERKVRKELESQCWIIDKWTNNVDLETKELIKAKSNRFNMRSTGFPDFIIYKKVQNISPANVYQVGAVECKSNGYLKPIEKEKCRFLLDKKIFDVIFIASKDETASGGIKYEQFVK